ncbi:glycosyltransferase [Caenimonas koreensis DSM 17982]|uniref:Glycosyltransferase n=1 Tax=Caenimonas koreensis DSM 17982 TaxID=1121255 RepID=A0A844BAN3_9BURK|nr:glycosyltransferase family 2 protein [Caenimonas koreensis]MRD48616.1 glycosyltransferase [Caenimonas koreensis DSM 17982]
MRAARNRRGTGMRVIVVMSTYRGERFVAEQVRSILAQLPARASLLIRDDGSGDSTPDIVESIGDARIQLTRGSNIGFARSFFWLLSHVPPDAEMVMVCDQDDVWLPGRVDRAWAHIGNAPGKPILYFSRLTLVDEELRVLGDTPLPPRGPSFANAVIENIVTGCTIALSPAAVALVCRTGRQELIYFHDWWIYLVVSALGQVVMDPQPTVLYRQHGSNVIGRGAGWRRYLTNASFVRRRSWLRIMFDMDANFREVHGAALQPWQRELIDNRFDASRPSSILRLLFVPRRQRQYLMDELLLRAMLVLELLRGRPLLSPPAKA